MFLHISDNSSYIELDGGKNAKKEGVSEITTKKKHLIHCIGKEIRGRVQFLHILLELNKELFEKPLRYSGLT